jgi:hypothetical protein
MPGGIWRIWAKLCCFAVSKAVEGEERDVSWLRRKERDDREKDDQERFK